MSELERLELKREVLLKLIKALLDGEELEEIAKIISMDPNLSAKLLKFINSPYFGLRKEIKSIIQTVAYLGYKNLRDYIFVLLTTSLLKSGSKEEIKNSLKFAYLLRNLSEKLLPEHKDEAFMVGILEPVREEVGEDELKEILEKAGVSEYVINGFLNPESKLGKLKEIAKKILPLCKDLEEGKETSLPVDLSQLKKEDVVESCVLAEDQAQSLIATL